MANNPWMNAAGVPPGLMGIGGATQTGGALGSIPQSFFGGQQGQPVGQIVPAGYAPSPQPNASPGGIQGSPGGMAGWPAGLLVAGQQQPGANMPFGGAPQQSGLMALWNLINGMGGSGGGFSMNGNANQSALGQFAGQFGNAPGGFSANGSAYR